MEFKIDENACTCTDNTVCASLSEENLRAAIEKIKVLDYDKPLIKREELDTC